ncbi:MAG: Smr/MutS family protein [Lysobacterales bacterium]
MVKKLKQGHLDEELFRQEMTGVIPLKATPRTDSKAPRRIKRVQDRTPLLTKPEGRFLLSADDQTSIDSGDGTSHRKNGIQNRTMQKLKRGRFTVGAELDLHSMTTETAYSALLEFIEYAQSASMESVRVIHGKGLRSKHGPRLKLMTQQLLREHPGVLAYTSCKPADGGAGAVEVLLKSL